MFHGWFKLCFITAKEFCFFSYKQMYEDDLRFHKYKPALNFFISDFCIDIVQ